MPERTDESRCFTSATGVRRIRTQQRPRVIRSSSSAPARSDCRRRSISPSAACRRCCSTMPTGSGRARAASATPSARSKSWTGSASAKSSCDMGVTWKLGKVYLGDELVYSFDLLPEDGHKMPAFINLQQYYLEKALVDRALELPQIDLRWRNRVSGIERRNDGVTAHDRNAGRPLSSGRRLGDRRRRRALDHARSPRARIQGRTPSRTNS